MLSVTSAISDAKLDCLHSWISVTCPSRTYSFRAGNQIPNWKVPLESPQFSSPKITDVQTQAQRREVIYSIPWSKVVTELVCSLPFLCILCFILDTSESFLTDRGESPSGPLVRVMALLLFLYVTWLGLRTVGSGTSWLGLLTCISLAGCVF